MVDRLRPAHANPIKVDIADHPALARGFGIAGTLSFEPTLSPCIRFGRDLCNDLAAAMIFFNLRAIRL